jgi:hypothetical protein
MQFENHPGERESLIQTADRLRRLASDLIEIAHGRAPRAEHLADAPILDRYFVAEKKVDCLIGVQSGHPTLDGPVIQTSEVYVTAIRGGWARTLSRYYRLGRPFLTQFDA